MNGLTIRYRLRFAVAVTMAALLLLTLGTRASYAQTTATTNEYIVEMQASYTRHRAATSSRSSAVRSRPPRCR